MARLDKIRPESPPASGSSRILPYAIALLLLPALVLWRHDDPLYTPLWQADPWFYLGYFRDLVSFKRDLFPGFYYGSRLSWILPGYLLHWLFPPLVANAILHLSVHSISVLCLFATLWRMVGVRSAYLSAMIFSLHPWFWAATGWDQVNGGAIAYFLLAMALLTRAAARPIRKWTLFLAGMAIAGSVHAHLFLVAFAPLLLLHYFGFAWAWRRASLVRSLPVVSRWLAAGFVIFTLPICAINAFLLDGNPWFWTPSLHTAQAVTQRYAWSQSVIYDRNLVPFLWIVAVAVTAALVLLPSWWKQAVTGRNAAGLIFSAQLLLSTALMAFFQARGITLLGHYHYACYLLPFAFLVLGASMWPAVEDMDARAWKITYCAATVVFGSLWVEPAKNAALAHWMTEAAAFLLTVGLLTVALVLRRRNAGAWLALAGLAMLTSLTYTGTYRWGKVHSTRQEYLRVMAGRQQIEQLREGAPVRFWYDKGEPAFHEYFALNASYLAEFARVGDPFPEGCRGPVNRDALVAVTSRKENTPGLAVQALTECWKSSGMKPVIRAVQQMNRPGEPYRLVLLKAVDDFSVERPLRVTFDAEGVGRLEFKENPTELLPLPRERWIAATGAAVQSVGGELAVRTPQARSGYAVEYAPLVVPAAGRYRFELNYQAGKGQFLFGLLSADKSHWLTGDSSGRRTGDGRAMTVTLDLKAGERIVPMIANNNNRDVAASLVVQDLTVTEVPLPM